MRCNRGTCFALVLLILLSHPARPAVIIVDNTTCTLVDAIEAANTDTAVGGCTAGSGADTVELTADVTLRAVHNGSPFNTNGLPRITSDVSVTGHGFKIDRADGAPEFRFFQVSSKVKYKLGDDLASYASPVLATIGDRRWCFVFARGGLLGFEPKTGELDFHYPWRARALFSVNASTVENPPGGEQSDMRIRRNWIRVPPMWSGRPSCSAPWSRDCWLCTSPIARRCSCVS